MFPTIATVALGAALLVPLRDDRRGKRATVGTRGAPLRPNFEAVFPLEETVSATADESTLPAPPADATPAGGEANTRTLPAHAALRSAMTLLTRMGRAAFENGPGETNTAPPATVAPEAAYVERSFAGELALLLTRTDETYVPAQPAPPEAPASFEVVRTLATSEDDVRQPETGDPLAIVVRGALPPSGRVVPLTRLPLRPASGAIGWPAFTGAREDISRAERHEVLLRIGRRPQSSDEEALLRAYREEDDAGRVLALRALTRGAFPSARDVFAHALQTGREDERAMAIDALAALGERETIATAFADRFEAIAARAALAYVGTNRREDYHRTLEGCVDAARIEAILALLAGVVE